jgi:hypothetical protein
LIFILLVFFVQICIYECFLHALAKYTHKNKYVLTSIINISYIRLAFLLDFLRCWLIVMPIICIKKVRKISMAVGLFLKKSQVQTSFRAAPKYDDVFIGNWQ